MWDKYCEEFKGGLCDKTRTHVPRNFCHNYCKGRWVSPAMKSEGRTQGELPGIGKMAVGFATAATKHILSGRPQRTNEQIEKIQKICKGCDKFTIIKGKERCTECGCFLSVKRRWATADCPLGKWPDELRPPEVPQTVTEAFEMENPQYQKHPIETSKRPGVFRRADGSNANLIDMYHGKSVFVIANGPSFGLVDARLLKLPGIITFGMNNGAHIFRPNLWSGQDGPHKFMNSIWEDPTIIKFTDWNNREKEYETGSGKQVKNCPSIFFHGRKSDFTAHEWLSKTYVSWGRKRGSRGSLLAVLHICFMLGFKRIFLLGVDWKMSSEYTYFFPQYRSDSAVRSNTKLYKNLSEYLRQLRPQLELQGVYIYNCTADSLLTAFDYVPLMEAIKSCVIDISDTTEGRYEKKKNG
jgi:hypothetical protein